uniref:Uncharacterized protein n=1 Tax=Arundo donax TaxID=35708 RepID=A0A0A9E6D2_ARUDO
MEMISRGSKISFGCLSHLGFIPKIRLVFFRSSDSILPACVLF